MAKVSASLFISLDGVVEVGNGEWHFPYFNDEMGAAVDAGQGTADTMLFGRTTYDSFAGAWPEREAGRRGGRPVRQEARRHAQDRRLPRRAGVHWRNSEQLQGDLVEAVTTLKEQPGAHRPERLAVGGAPAPRRRPRRRAAPLRPPDRRRPGRAAVRRRLADDPAAAAQLAGVHSPACSTWSTDPTPRRGRGPTRTPRPTCRTTSRPHTAGRGFASGRNSLGFGTIPAQTPIWNESRPDAGRGSGRRRVRSPP